MFGARAVPPFVNFRFARQPPATSSKQTLSLSDSPLRLVSNPGTRLPSHSRMTRGVP